MKRFLLYTGIYIGFSSIIFADIDDGKTVVDRLNSLEVKDFNIASSQGGNLFAMSGDYLYWRSYVQGLPFATTYETTHNNFGTNFKFLEFTQSYHSGFRVMAQYELPFDQWTIGGTWMRFSQSASSKVVPTANKRLIANWDLSGKLTAQTAQGTLYERLEIVDATIGKNFLWSKPFTLRYEVGGRGVWLDEHMRANYTGSYQATNTSLTYPMATKVYVTNAFSGIGLLNSLSALWNLGAGFSIYGNGNFSAIWGKFVLNTNQDITISNIPPDLDNIQYNNKIDTIKTNIDGSIGLKWAFLTFKKSLRVTLKAAYEFSYWPNQIQASRALVFPTVPTATPQNSTNQVGGSMTLVQEQGDVSFQGYVFGLMFDF